MGKTMLHANNKMQLFT